MRHAMFLVGAGLLLLFSGCTSTLNAEGVSEISVIEGGGLEGITAEYTFSKDERGAWQMSGNPLSSEQAAKLEAALTNVQFSGDPESRCCDIPYTFVEIVKQERTYKAYVHADTVIPKSMTELLTTTAQIGKEILIQPGEYTLQFKISNRNWDWGKKHYYIINEYTPEYRPNIVLIVENAQLLPFETNEGIMQSPPYTANVTLTKPDGSTEVKTVEFTIIQACHSRDSVTGETYRPICRYTIGLSPTPSSVSNAYIEFENPFNQSDETYTVTGILSNDPALTIRPLTFTVITNSNEYYKMNRT